MTEKAHFMTTSQVAKRLRISVDRVRQLARSGRLPPDRETDLGQRLWLPESVERFAATRGRWGRYEASRRHPGSSRRRRRSHSRVEACTVIDPLPHIDPEEEDRWVAQRTGIDLATVHTVLSLEFEYMVGAGIAYSEIGTPWDYQFYEPGEIRPSEIVDTEQIARDAERLAGIPRDIAARVLDGESEYFVMRGIVSPDDGVVTS